MLAQAVSIYVVAQLILIAAAVLAGVVARFGRFQEQLRLNYVLLALAASAIALHTALPSRPVWQPVVRIWAPAPLEVHKHIRQAPTPIAAPLAQPTERVDLAFLFAFGMILGAALIAAGSLLLGAWRLRCLAGRAFRLRALGGVRVLVSEECLSPFSYRTFTRAYVVLPISLLAKPRDLRLSLAHELQHHRQGDTGAAYVLFALKSLSFWNPLVHRWMAWIAELQEFACDEALLQRADAQEYARCLAEAAQTALAARVQPVCATGLLSAGRRQLLSRRIAQMFTEDKRRSPKGWMSVAALAAVVLLATTAYATRGLVQDRRVTMAEAQKMAEAARKGSAFPIVVNQEVLRELNRSLGTPEGRQYLKKALARMQNYTGLVQEKIRAFGAPEELAAVPIVESGYANLHTSPEHSAGLWMFIASTARKYGMTVDGVQDQRLNEPQETEAAIRYLSANHDRFGDWQLALLAYNAGEARVQEGLDETGTHDAWSLIHAGFEGDRGYLAKVMAAVLILKNPRSLE